jgi:methionyl aminopeptidase
MMLRMQSHPTVKSKSEVDRMRASGRAVATVLTEVGALVRPGVTTGDLNEAARAAMDRLGVKPSFLRYAPNGRDPYPAVLCVSVDSQVVHGIPGRCSYRAGKTLDVPLREGEIVSLDCGVVLDGFHGDSAITLPVGEVSDAKRKLMDACRSALWAGIRAMRPGATLVSVVAAIERASKGYGNVAQYGGHGIGRRLHEPPFVPNRTDSSFDNYVLSEGYVLALEPMLNLGDAAVYEATDGWTVMTADGSASAHFEHTVAVTKDGFEVLTLRDGESPS